MGTDKNQERLIHLYSEKPKKGIKGLDGVSYQSALQGKASGGKSQNAKTSMCHESIKRGATKGLPARTFAICYGGSKCSRHLS